MKCLAWEIKLAAVTWMCVCVCVFGMFKYEWSRESNITNSSEIHRLENIPIGQYIPIRLSHMYSPSRSRVGRILNTFLHGECFMKLFCQRFSLTNCISYWNLCIWLAESKSVSENHGQDASWNAPLDRMAADIMWVEWQIQGRVRPG